MDKEIAIIIPSLSPDEKLLGLLKKLRECPQIGTIIVVNDGSTEEYDTYFEQAVSQYSCVLLRHAVNLGKGRALKTAFNYLLGQDRFAGAITVDSDGQHTVPDILKIRKAMEQNPGALILGCRKFRSNTGADIPWKSMAGNRITCQVMKLLCGIHISDTQTGLRGISRDFMRILMNVKGERFEYETNMLLQAKEHEIPFMEVPIETIYLEENKSSHFNPVRDSIQIYALFGRFLFASLSSFVIDIALFALFVSWLRPVAPLQYILFATAGARVVSSLYNYMVNKKATFKSDSSHAKSLPRYYILCVMQMLLSAALVILLSGSLHLNESAAKVAVDAVLFLVSYQIQREWVFKRKREG